MPPTKGSLTPAAAAREVLAYFRTHANAARAEELQRYFKEPVDYYGIDQAPFKEWRVGFQARLAACWTIREAVEFCELMLQDRYMESRGSGFLAVGLFVDQAGPELLTVAKRWLVDVCDNWGLVDSVVPAVVSPLLRKHPELVSEVVGWAQSPNQWVRRGAAVAFVGLVREDRFRDAAYEVASRLADEREDLVQKAVGWMLREAGKVDRDRLEAYLLEQGPRTPRTTLRYAIERFSKEDRQRLLAVTRTARAS